DTPSPERLDARLNRDLERGATSLGPHLDDIRIAASERDLRNYGSQGEQRLTVLSLLLAEAELLADQRGVPPLLLLDDVLSELDYVGVRARTARIGHQEAARCARSAAGSLRPRAASGSRRCGSGRSGGTRPGAVTGRHALG